MTAEPLSSAHLYAVEGGVVDHATTYLEIEADLGIEVDTASGHTCGRLTGEGRHLVLQLDQPEVLTGTTGRAALAALATRLAQARIGVEVHGPHGRIATLDPDRTSRVAAWVTGSPHIVLDPAARPLATAAALSLARREFASGRLIGVLVLGAAIWLAGTAAARARR